ncbi:hypothetical protein GGR51DRAFT_574073 [Nemania sp. FL0031]|nr:hypothetical protein GGR51DRAFT_574073 [Nemania sp. FL0031]
MDKMKNENTKAESLAWRRKPRKFAPKSRLGCKTCKIRRIKCDLARPSCLKCRSTGRTCDGYGETPLAPNTELESSHYHNDKASSTENCDSYRPCAITDIRQPRQRHSQYNGHILHDLGPFMILPVAGTAQTEAMCFFEYISIKNLNEYSPSEPWRKTLMFFSQTVPSVRYAAIALALIHRNYLARDSSDHVNQPPPDKAPLFYYNRAIQLLLNQEIGDSVETTAITLLVCYLFTCFDHLAGNYVQAMKHLRGGVELSRSIDKAMLNGDEYDDAKPSGVKTLICQVTSQIRRLDMQAVTFLVDWTPTDNFQEQLMSQFLSSRGAFRSFGHAADCLHLLVAQVMRLRNTVQHIYPAGKPPPSPLSLKDILLGQLETWSGLFEHMIQQDSACGSEPFPRISLLRLQHTIAWTLLQSYGPGREMDYDNFLPQFQQCVALAGEIAFAHERYTGSLKPTFTPEIGIIPVLYIIGVKCRHPAVRREALSILRRQPIREAVWNSVSAATVVERVIDIEEGGTIRSMEQIAMSQRIEDMTWIHVVCANRLDISYTFCGREGLHTEFLMIK